MRAWLERSFRNRIFLTVLLVALVPLLLCDVLMTQMMIFRSEYTLRTDAQEEMALRATQLDALLTDLRRSRVLIPLKAVVTEDNAAWSSIKLHDELFREHEAMKSVRAKDAKNRSPHRK